MWVDRERPRYGCVDVRGVLMLSSENLLLVRVPVPVMAASMEWKTVLFGGQCFFLIEGAPSQFD